MYSRDSTFPHPNMIDSTHRVKTLTCNADVGFAALGGACRAPGNTLAPVIFGPEELLNLLAGNLNAYLSDNQTCQGTSNMGQCYAYRQKERSAGTEVCLQTSCETLQPSTNIYSATWTVIRM